MAGTAEDGKVWFITGASRGFGRIWARAALERGDRVAATARDPRALTDLVDAHGDRVLPLALDVTDRAADLAAVQRAAEHFGRLDVVVNNAGYGQFGAVEELSEQEVRDQFETNVFGAWWVTQAALPVMRRQGGGHLLQVSSIGGVASFPNTGVYHASKWALEGFSESLAQEVAEFGIRVTIVEPGAYGTDWSGSSARHGTPLPAYDAMRARPRAAAARRGDPEATAAAVLAVVDDPAPPLRLLLGEFPTELVRTVYAERLATWERWADVSRRAQGGRPGAAAG